MIKQDETFLTDFCIAAKLLKINREEVLKRLMRTSLMKRSGLDEVEAIVNSFFPRKEN